EVERQEDCDGEGDEEYLEDVEPDRAHRLLELAAPRRKHQRTQYLLIALHRHGDAELQPAAALAAHGLGAVAAERPLDLGIVGGGGIEDLMKERPVGPARQAPDDPVVESLAEIVEGAVRGGRR